MRDALSLEEALVKLSSRLDIPPPGDALDWVQGCRERLRASSSGASALDMAGDATLGELTYWLVRAIRPAAVIETGVAIGVTSAFALAALHDNRVGELWSIDMPTAELTSAGLIGAAVPEELRSRWRYQWGLSRRLLPATLMRFAGAGPCVFVHDSDHRFENMRWEFETARRMLDPGGWIIADDVHFNTAFVEFAAVEEEPPLLVAQADKPGITGVTRFSSRTQPARG